jgi:hypothetical protein
MRQLQIGFNTKSTRPICSVAQQVKGQRIRMERQWGFSCDASRLPCSIEGGLGAIAETGLLAR